MGIHLYDICHLLEAIAFVAPSSARGEVDEICAHETADLRDCAFNEDCCLDAVCFRKRPDHPGTCRTKEFLVKAFPYYKDWPCQRVACNGTVNIHGNVLDIETSAFGDNWCCRGPRGSRCSVQSDDDNELKRVCQDLNKALGKWEAFRQGNKTDIVITDRMRTEAKQMKEWKENPKLRPQRKNSPSWTWPGPDYEWDTSERHYF